MERPTHCRAGHELHPGDVHITWVGCLCSAAGGHRILMCEVRVNGRACGDEQVVDGPECTVTSESGRE